jgi:Protein of unknown function (DUF3768)
MSDRCSIKAARIRELNDQLRCKAIGGRIVITRGIEALGTDGVRKVLAAVARFDDFTEDNDPWGEHDCAVLTVDGRRIIFKHDYYDRYLQFHSPDAGDPAVTVRVLTIMLSEEY